MHERTPYKLPLPAADQVSVNKTSKIILSSAYLYYAFTLGVTDTASATDALILTNIKAIRLKRGSVVIRECTGAELQVMNARNGAQFGLVSNGAGAGTRKIWITLYLAEMWRKTLAHQFLSLIDARQYAGKYSIEVDFGAAAGVALDGWFRADESPYNQGAFIHWDRTDIALAGTKIDVPNFVVNGKLLSLDIANVGSTAGSVAGTVFSKVVLDLEPGKNKFTSDDTEMGVDLKQWDMTPQTGRFHLVMDYNDNLDNAPMLNPNSEIKLHVEGPALVPVPVIVEAFRPFSN